MTGCAIGRDETEARERLSCRLQRGRPSSWNDPEEYKATRGEATILGTIDEAA